MLNHKLYDRIRELEETVRRQNIELAVLKTAAVAAWNKDPYLPDPPFGFVPLPAQPAPKPSLWARVRAAFSQGFQQAVNDAERARPSAAQAAYEQSIDEHQRDIAADRQRPLRERLDAIHTGKDIA